MNSFVAISIFALACSACSTSDAELVSGVLTIDAVDDAAVSGTELTCTAQAAEALTPCYDAVPLHGTGASSPEPGVIRLALARSTNIADGGKVAALIDLRFADGTDDIVEASAQQIYDFDHVVHDPIPALAGWIRPATTSSTTDRRNAGRFSLDFEWGTVAGTYDTTNYERRPRLILRREVCRKLARDLQVGLYFDHPERAPLEVDHEPRPLRRFRGS